MKKLFESPNMSISKFSIENIVTTSGATDTYESKVRDSVAEAASVNITEISYLELSL